ncbi:MAG: hypothetical protein AVDCRST_MAG42-511 [uncultured Chthoniobacterales bacterium]|uniref:Uncharacterized protein n=1 Tax=uncultured Chthoniobacterales bacterium TaxID=1836801 RepID=A0A6J4HF64_9BACT|nr:MAG: hypothetical protein AVDCRST_MAG42-511 [uncultured Chthoniobacterales bacterium]
MHKDPPPSLLERPFQVIVVYGVITGFVAGVIVFGAWTLVSGPRDYTPKAQYPTSISDRER